MTSGQTYSNRNNESFRLELDRFSVSFVSYKGENAILFFNKFSRLNLLGNVQKSVWRICMWILGFIGLIQSEIPRF